MGGRQGWIRGRAGQHVSRVGRGFQPLRADWSRLHRGGRLHARLERRLRGEGRLGVRGDGDALEAKHLLAHAAGARRCTPALPWRRLAHPRLAGPRAQCVARSARGASALCTVPTRASPQVPLSSEDSSSEWEVQEVCAGGDFTVVHARYVRARPTRACPRFLRPPAQSAPALPHGDPPARRPLRTSARTRALDAQHGASLRRVSVAGPSMKTDRLKRGSAATSPTGASASRAACSTGASVQLPKQLRARWVPRCVSLTLLRSCACSPRLTPVPALSGVKVRSMSCGRAHTLLATQEGTVYSWYCLSALVFPALVFPCAPDPHSLSHTHTHNSHTLTLSCRSKGACV